MTLKGELILKQENPYGGKKYTDAFQQKKKDHRYLSKLGITDKGNATSRITEHAMYRCIL